MRFLIVICGAMMGCVPAFPDAIPIDVDAGPDACQPAIEICNGVDDDCDDRVDEDQRPRACPDQLGICIGVTQACQDGAWQSCEAAIAALPEWQMEETTAACDTLDNDCDGAIDERCDCVDDAVQPCGADVGRCEPGEQICAAGAWGECVGATEATDEICNGEDDDCDDGVDEGVLNACGRCGPLPEETCNGIDEDCDDRIDEGVLNACNECGPVPDEICNAEDDDCDGSVDEGVANACGQCGPLPADTCNGMDDDCDGTIDEGIAETCNGSDDNCDGVVDNIPALPCNDAPGDAPCNQGVNACLSGVRICQSMCE